MEAELTERLAFGDRALSAVVEAMPLIHFDASKRSHLYAVTLHASITQLCGGCLALARAEHTAGIPILLRSIYEALVDLDNLVKDANYHERMDAANLTQILKLLKASPSNPLLQGLEKKHDISALTTEFQREVDGLISRKRGPMDMRARCGNVNRGDEYASIYLLLCLDAHNNVAALADRHVTGDQVTTSLQANLFGDGNPLGLSRRIYFAVGWMLQSAEFVHGAFRTGYLGIAALQRQHAELRHTYAQ